MGYSNSAAHDKIDAAVIKHGAALLHGPITHIVNISITSERFVTKWKIGRLLPLPQGKWLEARRPHCIQTDLAPLCNQQDYRESLATPNHELHDRNETIEREYTFLQEKPLHNNCAITAQ